KSGGHALAEYNSKVDGPRRCRVRLAPRLVDGHSRLGGIDNNRKSSRRDRGVAGGVFGLSGDAVIARREIYGNVPVAGVVSCGCAERGSPVEQLYGTVLFCGAAET